MSGKAIARDGTFQYFSSTLIHPDMCYLSLSEVETGIDELEGICLEGDDPEEDENFITVAELLE